MAQTEERVAEEDMVKAAAKPPAQTPLPALLQRYKDVRSIYESEISQVGGDLVEVIRKTVFYKGSPVVELGFTLERRGSQHGFASPSIGAFTASVRSGPMAERGFSVDDIPKDAPWGPPVRAVKAALDQLIPVLERSVGYNNRVTVTKEGSVVGAIGM